ncbi:hypothetical protein CKM354_000490400 [Cercospora kikuchii]|uniref:Carrier domain-containing protein n=1 Tax=Cercospora kikuchii TaxID=84275 RepID=A0A9P3CKV6_9PEZI|nr:uncharacterized protein CKM354_000490400 [Cercospora kikuchii]GIZ41605.1 hypothetical protein CKM354_000490400 [Cercospora kikuchii]
MDVDPPNDAHNSPREVESLPLVLENLARDYPNHVFTKIPLDEDLTAGWRDITYRDLADAANALARWIVREIGIGTRNDVAAYIGINDMRYAVAQIGLIRAGYIVLLPSPRNSQEGQASLISTTKCKFLLHSEDFEARVAMITKAAPELQVMQIPTFDELLRQASASAPEALMPCPAAYTNKAEDRVVILHTSGTTGYPKPIYHTNGSISTFKAVAQVSAPPGRRAVFATLMETGTLMFAVTPFFHTMGAATVWTSLFCRTSISYLPPNKPPTSKLIIKALDQIRPKVSIFPPSIIEELIDTPSGWDTLCQLEYVAVGGGPLAHGVGERVNQGTRLVSCLGSTEAGLMASLFPEDKEDWQYFEFMAGSGVAMEPEEDDLYEMTIRPTDDCRYQSVFHIFPSISKWRTKDLFEEHPNKKGLWRYKGRKDDVLVLSNGEKFNPVDFEKNLESHSLIKGALVIGQARFQTGLLIEPDWDALGHQDRDLSELVEELWPFIEQANKAAPAHGRVWKSKVAIAKRDKHFKRAPKGSIMRRQTTDLYSAEIEALYSNEGTFDELGALRIDRDAGIVPAMEYLRKAFKAKGFEIPDDASPDADIFSYGIDSLQVMALSSILSHGIGKPVSPRVIYSHPSIRSLAEYLTEIEDDKSARVSREEVMEAMIKKYTHDLPSRSTKGTPALSEHTVLLTGSTGSLGGHVLEELISSPSVAHVYALNRSTDAETRQAKQFKSRGLSIDGLRKVSFLTADFGREHFGLDLKVYDAMLQSVDICILNAWAVDFNKTLATYEAVHIAGTRRAVDFCVQSKHNAQIVFISSIASVGNWFHNHAEKSIAEHMAIPEEMPKSHSVSLPQGYGESKHVASMILAHAAKKAGIAATIVRAGQLSGSVVSTAEWNRHEWLPSIIITSKALALIPESLGVQDTVDWVPMDLAARAVVEIALARAHDPAGLDITHISNPRTVSWKTLIPAVREALERETGREMAVVPFRDWLEALRASPVTPAEIEKKPGLKLLEFYEEMASAGIQQPSMATTHTQELSRTMRDMAAIDGVLMTKWLREWQQ